MGVTALNVVKVNVLRWNEKVRNIQESHGLFMVRFNKTSKKAIKPRKNNSDNNAYNDSDKDCFVSVFESVHLSAPDSTEWLVSKAMQASLKFLSDEEDTRTRTRLTTAISAYLFRYFRLNRDNDQETKPRIVIVVELPLSIIKNCTPMPRTYYDNDVGEEDGKLGKALHPKAKSKGTTRSSLRFVCVSGKLCNQEVKEIRGILLLLLREPILLWVKPVVTYEPTGLYQVEELVNVNYQPEDTCSVC